MERFWTVGKVLQYSLRSSPVGINKSMIHEILFHSNTETRETRERRKKNHSKKAAATCLSLIKIWMEEPFANRLNKPHKKDSIDNPSRLKNWKINIINGTQSQPIFEFRSNAKNCGFSRSEQNRKTCDHDLELKTWTPLEAKHREHSKRKAKKTHSEWETKIEGKEGKTRHVH